MTSRERTNAMMRGHDHDRIPRCEMFWPETLANWRKDGFIGQTEADALEFMGSDLLSVGWGEGRPFPVREEIIEKDEGETVLVRDWWGGLLRRWKDPNHYGTPEHISWEVDSPDVWYDKYKPALRENTPFVFIDKAKTNFAIAEEKQLWRHLTGMESFEMLRRTVGDEEMLMAMVEEPDWIADMSRTYTSVMIREWEVVLENGIEADGIWVYGDLAFNHGPLCSPEMYKELIWPDHKRMGEWAAARDLPIIYHTDGDFRPVLDLLIEAGMTCIQPMEAKAGVDVRELAPKYGDRLSFFGNIDMQRLSQNDPAETEDEVVSKLKAGMATKRYAYHSDHSVPPGVSYETYLHLLRLLDEQGYYD
jgi:uroporphyrinogen decarboxylase